MIIKNKIAVGIATSFTLMIVVIGWQNAKIDSLQQDAGRCQSRVSVLQSNEASLEQAIRDQNSALLELHEETNERRKFAEVRAGQAEAKLSEALKRDRKITADPQEMNQWFESLF